MPLFDASLPRSEWERRKAAHAARMRPWAEDRVRRSGRGIKHPVYDFLFEYYSFRPSHLIRWSPGVAVRLEGATSDDVEWKSGVVACAGGLVLPASSFPSHRTGYLTWACDYLEAVAARDALHSCFGLHEWAMVYRTDDIRHSRIPLRVSAEVVGGVVEAQGLRCSHYDAYRFFTPAARPQNRVPLTRAEAVRHDQPGCVHANMDLYKFAYAIAPYTASELIADAFELAVAARELDMRASPYDLRAFDFMPIAIETREGREEYVREQQAIALRAGPIRLAVLAEYGRVRSAVEA